MQEAIIARRYAQAFVKSFPDASLSILEKIKAFQHFFITHKSFVAYLSLACIPMHIKKEFLKELSKHYSFQEFLIPLIDLLAEHKRIFLLPAILSYMHQLYKDLLGVMEWSIISYPVLNPQNLNSIQHFLESQTGKKVLYTYQVDKSVIAGIRAQSTDFLWDYSLNNILQSLMNSFQGVSGGN
jgi:F-type H+-transporting ATPase subunit delta